MQTSRESNCSFLGVNHTITKQWVFICSHDHISILTITAKSLICLLSIHLQFKEASVHLIDSQNRPNPFSQGLSQHSFSLDTDTFNTIHHNQCSVSNRSEEHTSELQS